MLSDESSRVRLAWLARAVSQLAGAGRLKSARTTEQSMGSHGGGRLINFTRRDEIFNCSRWLHGNDLCVSVALLRYGLGIH